MRVSVIWCKVARHLLLHSRTLEEQLPTLVDYCWAVLLIYCAKNRSDGNMQTVTVFQGQIGLTDSSLPGLRS